MFAGKLEAAKDALSHTIPDGDTEAVLTAALDLLLEKAARRRGLVEKPRSAPRRPSADPRHIPAAVAREVWKRDGARCVFPLPDGTLCGSTKRLQLDHLTPVALGGKSEPPYLRVACERHNQLAARWTFGDRWMDQFTRKGSAEAGPAKWQGEGAHPQWMCWGGLRERRAWPRAQPLLKSPASPR